MQTFNFVTAGLGFLLLGFILGLLFYRWLQRVSHHMQYRDSLCGDCEKEGFVSRCIRCARYVGHCHSITTLLPYETDGSNFNPRPSRHICTRCLTPEEKVAIFGKES